LKSGGGLKPSSLIEVYAYDWVAVTLSFSGDERLSD